MSKNKNMAVPVTKMKLSTGDKIFNGVNIAIMALVCIVIVYPLYYVVIASMTDPVIVSGEALL